MRTVFTFVKEPCEGSDVFLGLKWKLNQNLGLIFVVSTINRMCNGICNSGNLGIRWHCSNGSPTEKNMLVQILNKPQGLFWRENKKITVTVHQFILHSCNMRDITIISNTLVRADVFFFILCDFVLVMLLSSSNYLGKSHHNQQKWNDQNHLKTKPRF